jgi:tellurite methyltransferase
MSSTADKWNSRYTSPDFHAAQQPAPFLLEALPFLPRGCALDLACGAGKNAVALVERGWSTAAVDVSIAALDRAEALASSRGLQARRASASSIPTGFPARHSARETDLLLLCADLQNFPLPASAFAVILCFRYLQRSLFSSIERALRPGGVLVFETFTLEQLSFDRGPRNPDHLLQPGELRRAFPGLTSLFYREWKSCSAALQGSTCVPGSSSVPGSTSTPGGTLGARVSLRGASGEALASLLARKSSG